MGNCNSVAGFDDPSLDDYEVGTVVEMNVRYIRYTQNSISPTFHGHFMFVRDATSTSFRIECKSLQKAIFELDYGDARVSDYPMMRVVKHQGHWYSLDNRRLFVFKNCWSVDKVPVRVAARDDEFWRKFHFDPSTENESVKVRQEMIRFGEIAL